VRRASSRSPITCRRTHRHRPLRQTVASGVAAATIEPAFFGFGFFADLNGNWVRDDGEPVGAGNGSPCRMAYRGANGDEVVTLAQRPERRNHPYDPDSFVVVNLSGVPGSASESWVKVEVKHEGDPAADFTDRVLVRGASGLLYVHLDQAATGAEISAPAPTACSPPRS